eukprot:TRINITY_DN993_c0_g1_i1.p1 TRINITY_DN993_c0_g1~~TRINITY_DN993_c0_g1_i1.p1  ORF type:complete len:116 (+),score=3.94 TRINITY_DN993_c0_g1_i1:98-445(+)
MDDLCPWIIVKDALFAWIMGAGVVFPFQLYRYRNFFAKVRQPYLNFLNQARIRKRAFRKASRVGILFARWATMYISCQCLFSPIFGPKNPLVSALAGGCVGFTLARRRNRSMSLR